MVASAVATPTHKLADEAESTQTASPAKAADKPTTPKAPTPGRAKRAAAQLATAVISVESEPLTGKRSREGDSADTANHTTPAKRPKHKHADDASANRTPKRSKKPTTTTTTTTTTATPHPAAVPASVAAPAPASSSSSSSSSSNAMEDAADSEEDGSLPWSRVVRVEQLALTDRQRLEGIKQLELYHLEGAAIPTETGIAARTRARIAKRLLAHLPSIMLYISLYASIPTSSGQGSCRTHASARTLIGMASRSPRHLLL